VPRAAVGQHTKCQPLILVLLNYANSNLSVSILLPTMVDTCKGDVKPPSKIILQKKTNWVSLGHIILIPSQSVFALSP
jgi:hypothetical protein